MSDWKTSPAAPICVVAGQVAIESAPRWSRHGPETALHHRVAGPAKRIQTLAQRLAGPAAARRSVTGSSPQISSGVIRGDRKPSGRKAQPPPARRVSRQPQASAARCARQSHRRPAVSSAPHAESFRSPARPGRGSALTPGAAAPARRPCPRAAFQASTRSPNMRQHPLRLSWVEVAHLRRPRRPRPWASRPGWLRHLDRHVAQPIIAHRSARRSGRCRRAFQRGGKAFLDLAQGGLPPRLRRKPHLQRLTGLDDGADIHPQVALGRARVAQPPQPVGRSNSRCQRS